MKTDLEFQFEYLLRGFNEKKDWGARLYETVCSDCGPGGLDGIDRLRDRHPDITGALCFSDVIAHGALHRLNALRLRVPDAFSIMGIENLPGSEFTYPQLTSGRRSVERMGELTAEAVISWLNTGMRPAPVSLPVELVQRGSTIKVPGGV